MSNLMKAWDDHCSRSAVAGSFSVGAREIVYFGNIGGDFIDMKFLVRADNGAYRACRGLIERGAFGHVATAHDVFLALDEQETPMPEIPLSEMLRGFGVGEERAQFAEQSVSRFMAVNLDASENTEMAEKVRAALLQREDARLRPLAARVASELSHDVIAALSATDSFTSSDYQFFAADGDRGMRRRQAAAAYPVLAAYIPRRPALRLAVDTARPLNEALQKTFGEDETGQPRLSKGALKRLQGIKWRPGGAQVDRLAYALSELPVDWLPATKDDWDAFSAITSTVGFILKDATGMSLDQLYAGCGGKWVAFAERLSKAYTDTRPPEGLTADELKEWDGRQTPPDTSREAMRNATLDAEDMLKAFAAQVVVPAAAFATKTSDVFLARLHIEHAYRVAASILVAGKSAAAIFELSRHWHSQQARIENDILGTNAAPQIMESIPVDGWAPIIYQPVIAPNGVTITPLFTKDQLRAEGAPYGGAPERDENGATGLNHCVSTHAYGCMREGRHILSMRSAGRDAPYKRLSTVEIDAIGQDRKIRQRQHYGLKNSAPPLEASDAWNWFKQAVELGHIPINFDGIREFGGDAVQRGSIVQFCGYDWQMEDNVANALRTWSDYVGKKFRKMSMAEFCGEAEIVGLAEALVPGYSSRYLVTANRAR